MMNISQKIPNLELQLLLFNDRCFGGPQTSFLPLFDAMQASLEACAVITDSHVTEA